MVNLVRLFLRVLPNLFVLGVSCGLFATSEFVILPNLLATQAQYSPIWILFQFLISGLWAMWVWCWFELIASNPGRVLDDLRERGFLREVLRGDIPRCLQHLKICPRCNLPNPPGSGNCSMCDACHLRFDHHCGVTGQCVADRNFKFFILNFFYGGVMCFLMFIPSLISAFMQFDILPTLIAAYSGLLALVLLGSGFCFLWDNARDARSLHRECEARALAGAYIGTFGNMCLSLLLPLQKTSTLLAWPGVDWSGEHLMLL
jgi:hypothetical protein